MARRGKIAVLASALFAAASLIATAGVASELSPVAAFSAPVLSSAVGVSSYYGPGFYGRPTATGEIMSPSDISAAHKTLPIPCYARVTNLVNGASMVVRVNDRGPYIAGRMLDVSERVAKLLGFHGGLSRVRLDYLGPASPASGVDQRALLLSLRSKAEPLVAKATDGVSVALRTSPALAFANVKPTAPAAAALEAAVKPMTAAAAPAAPPPVGALAIAAKLDASLHHLGAALENASAASARAVSPYGELVVSPFKQIVEASRQIGLGSH